MFVDGVVLGDGPSHVAGLDQDVPVDEVIERRVTVAIGLHQVQIHQVQIERGGQLQRRVGATGRGRRQAGLHGDGEGFGAGRLPVDYLDPDDGAGLDAGVPDAHQLLLDGVLQEGSLVDADAEVRLGPEGEAHEDHDPQDGRYEYAQVELLNFLVEREEESSQQAYDCHHDEDRCPSCSDEIRKHGPLLVWVFGCGLLLPCCRAARPTEQ